MPGTHFQAARFTLWLGLVFLGLAPAVQAMESQTYVIGWFGHATNSTDDDCPEGVHQEVEYQFLENLAPLGYSPEEIEVFREKLLAGDLKELMAIMGTRGRIDGQPVNPYTHPAAVADPDLPALQGKYAYGFDLDGNGETADGFIDPETGATGVDHQMYRALGCARSFRGSLAGRPTYWDWAWGQTRGSQPAWLLTISTKPDSQMATVRLERALEHLVSNSDGSPTAHFTYRVDPDRRSHNEFSAIISDGLLELTEHKTLRLLQNPLIAPEFVLTNTHLRLQMNRDNTIRGFVGGYQPWVPVYFGLAGLGIGGELQVTGDIPGLYHLLRKYADADPDPDSGVNQAISATYYFEAVPAFIIRPGDEGNALAAAASRESE
jgi:hypothetical protein